ncbi:MAG: phage protein GemA/Gp16 family protein [Bacteroidales bacterium]|nr:phage protein GemA/Gp16 family protein [Bacteroidales bacterium]
MDTTERTSPWRRAALADIHRMKSVLCMSDEDWRAFLAQWRVESSKDLTDDQLKELRHRLHDITDPRQTATGRAEADSKATDIIRWRKRVYGVIGAWLREGHYKSDAAAIRTVACRATRRDDFNQISLSELKQLYHSWCKKRETAANAETLKRVFDSVSLN